MILGTVGFMIGTGGSAIVSKTLGEGEKERIFVPCAWEENPYVSINMNEDGRLDVRFSKE